MGRNPLEQGAVLSTHQPEEVITPRGRTGGSVALLILIVLALGVWILLSQNGGGPAPSPSPSSESSPQASAPNVYSPRVSI